MDQPTAEPDTKEPDTSQGLDLGLQLENAARKSHSGQPATSDAGSGSVSPKQLEVHVQAPEDRVGRSDESRLPIPKGTSTRQWLRRSISKGIAGVHESASDTNQGDDTEKGKSKRLVKNQNPAVTDDKGGEKK